MPCLLLSSYVAVRAVLSPLLSGTSLPHPTPAPYHRTLRKLFAQRLRELASVGCRTTKLSWTRLANCPGLALTSDGGGAHSCNLNNFCPFCFGRRAALDYDNAVTSQREYERKWHRSTRWYLWRGGDALPGEVGRLTGAYSDVAVDPLDAGRPLSLVLALGDAPKHGGAFAVPSSAVGLPRAVARMNHYPPWLLLGPADDVCKFLDFKKLRRRAALGCLRRPTTAAQIGHRVNLEYLPPRRAVVYESAAGTALDALRSAVRDASHSYDVLRRLKLPKTTRAVVTCTDRLSAGGVFRGALPRPEPGAVNVLRVPGRGYLVAVPAALLAESAGRPCRSPTVVRRDDCAWVPLVHAEHMISTGRWAAPFTGAVWRVDPPPCTSASARPPSTRPKKP